jgi:alpha-beta hydrolase superfamily lysophospholipase
MFHPPAAQAFWLGDAAAPMLAHFHPAQHNSKLSRRCGVVLCAPFGHEYMVSYLSLRMLAARLSAAGFDVLSFDYQHTGDAADISSAQIAAWQDNIRTAAACARTGAGTFGVWPVCASALCWQPVSVRIAALMPYCCARR